MADPTYDSEMSQPVHRPGMESVVNRGVDQNGSRTGDRPTVGAGKVDPFSIKGDGAPKGSAPPAASPAPTDASGKGGRDRESAVMSQVDQDVNG